MGRKKAKNKKKSELKIIFFIILVSAAMFIISTYAWFSTQRNVSITNLSGTVEVAEGLEISLDALNWSNGIVLGEEEGQLSIIDDAYDSNPSVEGYTSPNLKPTEMLPVSTLGLVTKSTMTGLEMLRGKLTNTKELSGGIVTDETMTEVDNNVDLPHYYGYFAFDIFLKNSSKENKEDLLQLNYDSSLEILETKNSVTGLQNTARIAFAKYGGNSNGDGTWDGVTDTMASQGEVLKKTGAYNSDLGGKDVYLTDVAIWEPNANDHVEYIVNNNNNITWSTSDALKYNKTLANGETGFDLDTQIPTYALKESAKGAKINDIYVWDGSESTLAKQVVLQTTKTSDTDYTIKDGVQNLISTSDTGDGTTTFKLPPNSIIRLRVYMWLEGQDVDCINYASHGGGVKVNIGLVKNSPVGSHEPTETPAVQP